MAPLESPLEAALAFNYLSFEFLTSLNTVWTLVAVITTAVVGVWGIRNSSPPRGSCIDEPSHLTWYPSSEPTHTSISAEPPVTASAAESASPAFDSVGRTSRKFAVYFQKYEDDNGGNDNVNSRNDGGNDGDDVEEYHWVGDSYEGIMNIRMGVMDWYRYQDLKVLDGSVVRLWDGCGRRKAATPFAECDDQGHVMWCRCQHGSFSEFHKFCMKNKFKGRWCDCKFGHGMVYDTIYDVVRDTNFCSKVGVVEVGGLCLSTPYQISNPLSL